MTRDEKKFFERLLLQSGISSFFEWPRNEVR